jgi:hypothetical protein
MTLALECAEEPIGEGERAVERLCRHEHVDQLPLAWPEVSVVRLPNALEVLTSAREQRVFLRLSLSDGCLCWAFSNCWRRLGKLTPDRLLIAVT